MRRETRIARADSRERERHHVAHAKSQILGRIVKRIDRIHLYELTQRKHAAHRQKLERGIPRRRVRIETCHLRGERHAARSERSHGTRKITGEIDVRMRSGQTRSPHQQIEERARFSAIRSLDSIQHALA